MALVITPLFPGLNVREWLVQMTLTTNTATIDHEFGVEPFVTLTPVSGDYHLRCVRMTGVDDLQISLEKDNGGDAQFRVRAQVPESRQKG